MSEQKNKAAFNQGEFPATYYVQCMHYMAVTGASQWHLAVLVLNKGFHTFVINRDEDEIKALIDAEKAFWENHVLKQIPPLPDGRNASGEVISVMYPRSSKLTEVSLLGTEEKIKEFMNISQEIKTLEQKAEAIKQQIQLEMKEAEIGNALGYQVTWKGQNRTSIDSQRLKIDRPDIYETYTKTTSFRKFEIREVTR